MNSVLLFKARLKSRRFERIESSCFIRSVNRSEYLVHCSSIVEIQIVPDLA